MISEEHARYIASLACIYLQDNEAKALAKDLEGILGYVEQLKEVDADEVEPTTHVLPLKNVMRSDEVKPSLNREKLWESAVAHAKGCFQVPKVIE